MGAVTTKTNEQRVIDLVTKILKPLGYWAAVGTTLVREDDFLLFWEKDLSSTDQDVPGLTVQLHRDLVDDELLGEYTLILFSAPCHCRQQSLAHNGSLVARHASRKDRATFALVAKP